MILEWSDKEGTFGIEIQEYGERSVANFLSLVAATTNTGDVPNIALELRHHLRHLWDAVLSLREFVSAEEAKDFARSPYAELIAKYFAGYCDPHMLYLGEVSPGSENKKRLSELAADIKERRGQNKP